MKRILVPTDFAPASDRALEQAIELARLLRWEIHLLHKIVYPPPELPTGLLDRLDDTARFDYVLEQVIEGPERDAREELEKRKKNVESVGIAVAAHLERSGEIYERVETAVESIKPDLIVMGTHGRAGIRKWLMGSVAEKVLRHSSAEVLTLHADSPVASSEGGFGEILVATDFSEGSRRALESARGWARSLGGSIGLVHVLEERFIPPAGEGMPYLAPASREQREQAQSALRSELGGREGEVVLAEGNAASEIVRVAEERSSSWVVVGSQGLSRLERVLLGSVAERVARSCRAPVLNVR